MKRICQECGTEYARESLERICIKGASFQVCGGIIMPFPGADSEQTKCLVCLDSGLVKMNDGNFMKCHRGCELQGP